MQYIQWWHSYQKCHSTFILYAHKWIFISGGGGGGGGGLTSYKAAEWATAVQVRGDIAAHPRVFYQTFTECFLCLNHKHTVVMKGE